MAVIGLKIDSLDFNKAETFLKTTLQEDKQP